MNPVIRSGAQSLSDETGLFMGVMTLVFMAVFAAWTWYAYAPSRRQQMEHYGKLPFDDESEA